MNNKLIDHFDKEYNLSDEEKNALAGIETIDYEKGTVILREGQVASVCFYVLEGCIRQYQLREGEERIVNFFTEFQPVFYNDGYHTKAPSEYFFDCVEDTTVMVGTPEQEARMYEAFPKFERVSRLETEKSTGVQQKRLDSFVTLSPTERYLHIQQTRPDLIQRVPQYQLASYLGLTPESLSRIRRRIAERRKTPGNSKE